MADEARGLGVIAARRAAEQVPPPAPEKKKLFVGRQKFFSFQRNLPYRASEILLCRVKLLRSEIFADANVGKFNFT